MRCSCSFSQRFWVMAHILHLIVDTSANVRYVVDTSASLATKQRTTAMTTVTLPNTVTGDYTIDASHSRIGFVARHAMVTKVRGSFNDFAGSIHFDTTNPAASTAEISIDVASVNTRK